MSNIEQALQALITFLQGSVATAILVLAIIIVGLLWAMKGNSAGLRTAVQVIIGGAIIKGAAEIASLLGF